MKTLFLLLAAVAIAVAPFRLFAADVAWGNFVSVEIGGGAGSALTQEYVYEGEKCLSRLDWADAIAPALSIAGSAGFFNVMVQARIDMAVPVRSGVMEDYDFLSPGSTEPSLYSRHDAYLDKDFTGVLSVGYVFRLGAWELTPGIGFSYANRKWSAQDGYLQYPVSGMWTGDEPKQTVTGTVISYEQAVWFPFISLSVSRAFSRFGFAVTGSVSPVLKGETIDTHFTRSTRFYDTLADENFFSGGAAWDVSLALFYYPAGGKHLAFFIRGGYKVIAGLTGSASSGATGAETSFPIDNGTLVIDDGYSSKMERRAAGVSVGIVFTEPLFPKVAP